MTGSFVAMEEPEQVGVPSQLPSAHAVEYASPVRKPPHSAWSVVGFALAILSVVPPAIMWWVVAQAIIHPTVAGDSVTFHIGTMPLISLVPICACLIGLRRGRRGLAVAGIVIATLAMIAMFILVLKPSW